MKSKPYFGVYNFLLKNYPEIFKGSPDFPETRPHREIVNEIMVGFIREILEQDFKTECDNNSLIFNAKTIQNNWAGFTDFLQPEYDY